MTDRAWLFQLKNIGQSSAKLLQQKSKLLACLIASLVFLTIALPAQAASNISPRLEEQVLQIIRNHPEVLIESVQAYQQQQQQQLQSAQQAFLEELQTNPRGIVGNSPYQGAEEFEIVLVEFSDFQCPYCAQASQTLKQFMAKHGDRVTLAYKHFPITPSHPEAMNAARVAWAAGQQGKFWEVHDALFQRQTELGENLYQELARKFNLDLEQFERDRTLADSAIAQDMQLAASLGISGTPFFVMNNQAFTGAIQLDELEDILARVSAS
ncbi:thioredoxin domain-containing protein [Desertifilum sp. FACHB-1129]|uniref:Disulfide bond formation protein DsbA n=1 Tax=Desertifilum tharense IPPAS B-1220 TaxID=1781255 RepID=A0A1E5QPP8_9CYAN|nr:MULTISPECIES: DsbA family protein [Desertifilum]MDA0209870.1 thioredoxin domain-containing protein [Cyanobacteria bacterium FC1]MBD2310640.1 thioredoxin domain-containing protein [Desertifilum sp. FACHB-1129]MBD2320677.1 thioredoxin domain-containing protein [Desertifilum sp. FACHB-866]MBD2330805.1 thioredoxin domain-containing protein [Desertifilum sp. FACHB-868]OEJ76645.1 disulfide bond formation protein DsbA [Desertifilum tharense IPPAS B-1220]